MRRRKLIKRIGAASALGATGLGTAVVGGEPEAGHITHARVENEVGDVETVSLPELGRRQDLPSPEDLRSAVDPDVGAEDCCCDGCTNCFCCIC